MKAILLLCCFVAPPVPAMDSFAKESDALERTDAKRAILVVKWERLIAKHGNHPRVAEAMIALGHLLATEDLARDPLHKQDLEGSLAWFKKAARASKPGSDLWVEAQFLVAVRMAYRNPAEARAIFQGIVANRTDSLTLIRVEHEMATVCACERNRQGALQHDRNVLNWYRDEPRRAPADPDVKRQVDTVIRSACDTTTQYMTSFPIPKRERAAMIRKLMQERPHLAPLQAAGQNALRILDSMPETVPLPPTPVVTPGYDPPPSTGVSRTRVALSVAGVVALAGVGCVLFVLRRRRRRPLLAQPE